MNNWISSVNYITNCITMNHQKVFHFRYTEKMTFTAMNQTITITQSFEVRSSKYERSTDFESKFSTNQFLSLTGPDCGKSWSNEDMIFHNVMCLIWYTTYNVSHIVWPFFLETVTRCHSINLCFQFIKTSFKLIQEFNNEMHFNIFSYRKNRNNDPLPIWKVW